MEQTLEKYLEQIEKYLRPMAVSERIDVIREIKSEMQELQSSGLSAQEILERLGAPKALARAYLGESIVGQRGFRWRRLGALLGFYSLAGAVGLMILPITVIISAGFVVSGVLCLLAGMVKFGGFVPGVEIPWIGVQIGSYTASVFEFLPISIVTGVLLFGAGKLLWDLTLAIVRWLSRSRAKIRA